MSVLSLGLLSMVEEAVISLNRLLIDCNSLLYSICSFSVASFTILF